MGLPLNLEEWHMFTCATALDPEAVSTTTAEESSEDGSRLRRLPAASTSSLFAEFLPPSFPHPPRILILEPGLLDAVFWTLFWLKTIPSLGTLSWNPF